MGVFHHEDPSPPHYSKRCKFLTAALKDAFSNCHNGRRSISGPEDQEYQASDFDEEQKVVVSEIRSRAMEKLRRKPSSLIMSDSFSWGFSPRTRDLYLKAEQQKEEDDDNEQEEEEDTREEFVSVGSCFSCCSSAMSREAAYHSIKTNSSHRSSFNGLDFQDFRRSIIQEMCYCEGWPFGLCRKAVLLPPLPKSPSESWSWRKGTRISKMPYF